MLTGILGGTFNPFHNGHLRHALEVKESLGLDRVIIMPCADPPHKDNKELLDFALRVKLSKAAISDVHGLELSEIEETLPYPSYTWQTLTELRRRYPSEKIFFMMGVESFAALDKWHRGLELPHLACLVVVPREESDIELFHQTIYNFWSGPHHIVREDSEPNKNHKETVELHGGGKCIFLQTPRLDISSTGIRNKWKEGKSLAGLVPEKELKILHSYKETLSLCWPH